MKSNNYVLTFQSTHNALATEKILKNKDFEVELIPTPRQISAECGFSLLMENVDLEKIKDNTNPKIMGDIYLIIKNGKRKKYEKVN